MFLKMHIFLLRILLVSAFPIIFHNTSCITFLKYHVFNILLSILFSQILNQFQSTSFVVNSNIEMANMKFSVTGLQVDYICFFFLKEVDYICCTSYCIYICVDTSRMKVLVFIQLTKPIMILNMQDIGELLTNPCLCLCFTQTQYG